VDFVSLDLRWHCGFGWWIGLYFPQPKVLENYSEVLWKLMKGMRNILIHEYFGVDLEIVWKTVQESLPELVVIVRKAMSDETNIVLD
jgi:uncharacterized protein with HEPN domain